MSFGRQNDLRCFFWRKKVFMYISESGIDWKVAFRGHLASYDSLGWTWGQDRSYKLKHKDKGIEDNIIVTFSILSLSVIICSLYLYV